MALRDSLDSLENKKLTHYMDFYAERLLTPFWAGPSLVWWCSS